MAVRLRPFDPAFLQAPYPTYAALREQEPVKRVRIGPVAIFRLLRRFAKMRREMGRMMNEENATSRKGDTLSWVYDLETLQSMGESTAIEGIRVRFKK